MNDDLLYPPKRSGIAIVTLVYREPKIIETVRAWHEAMPNIPIYVFADGIDDQTEADLEYLFLDGQIHTPVHPSRARKGFAKAAREALTYMSNKTTYESLMLVDSDASYLPNEVKAISETKSPYVIGYRLDRKDAWYRKLYIGSEKHILRIMFGIKQKDPTCPLRLVNAEWAGLAAQRCKYSKWGFWMEFEVNYNRLSGLKPVEVAVHYISSPTKIYSPSKLPRILVGEALALAKLRLHLWGII